MDGTAASETERLLTVTDEGGEAACVHHWLLEAPTAATDGAPDGSVRGVCRICQSTRTFTNSARPWRRTQISGTASA